MCPARRACISKRVYKQKSQNEQYERPVQRVVQISESGQIIEEQEKNSCSELKNQQEGWIVIADYGERATNICHRVEQGNSVEQAVL